MEELGVPNFEEIISHPGFWNDLADDPVSCPDEDDCEDIEIQKETRTEKFPRRRLLEVESGSIPTRQLDNQNIEKFDFTTKQIKSRSFRSPEGIQLYMDPRSLRKAIHNHSEQLGLSDLGSGIPCSI